MPSHLDNRMSDISYNDDRRSLLSDADAPPKLPTYIKTVRDHPLIKKKTSIKGQNKILKSWSCLAVGCGKTWGDHNGTKALAHGSKVTSFCLLQHIAPCKGQSNEEEVKLFTDLYKGKQEAKSAKKRAKEAVKSDIAESQGEVAAKVVDKKKKHMS